MANPSGAGTLTIDQRLDARFEAASVSDRKNQFSEPQASCSWLSAWHYVQFAPAQWSQVSTAAP